MFLTEISKTKDPYEIEKRVKYKRSDRLTFSIENLPSKISNMALAQGECFPNAFGIGSSVYKFQPKKINKDLQRVLWYIFTYVPETFQAEPKLQHRILYFQKM
jgi:hypothetical protein